MNIPRNYNGNIVYDNISNNSIVITTSSSLGSIYMNNGILVNNKDSPEFTSFSGILYYKDNVLSSTDTLEANQLIFTDKNKNLQQYQIPINSIIYTDSNNKLSGGKISPKQIICTNDDNAVYGISLQSNSLLYVDINKNLSQLQLESNQIISTDSRKGGLQGYNLSANNILYTNENAEISQLNYKKNQIISTDGHGKLQGYNLSKNNILYTNEDGEISQLKYDKNQIIITDGSGNLSTYPLNGNKILYVANNQLTELDILENKNMLLYINNSNTLSTLSLSNNQIITTDSNNILKGFNLSANTIIYTDSNSSISQINFKSNQIISTDGYGKLQGYNLSANSIIYTNNSGNINQTSLNANSIMYTSDNNKIQFIPINNGGILNTYSFDGNTVSVTNPQITDKIVLNNCEIVNNNNERIQDNYLIYGKPWNNGGLSNIIIPKTELSYDYYYIINGRDGNVNISSTSQIYTDLYDKEYNNNIINTTANPILFNAIPICTSSDNKNMILNVLVPHDYATGNYYINSDGENNFSLKLFDNGSILPSDLAVQDSGTTTFNYRTQDILTVGTNVQKNAADEEFYHLTRSEKELKFPYLSGSGWKDLMFVNFLNSNNCSVTTNMNYNGPLVVGTSGIINKVTLGTNKKYILTNSCFSQLTVDGSDLQIDNTQKINLKYILQKNNNTITQINDDNINAGILHTNDQGDITFTQLESTDIPDNTITNDKIQNNTITATKIKDSTITADKIYDKTITSDKIALKSITGDNIADSTITAAKIATSTITGSNLYFADSLKSTDWSNIIIDNNNYFIKNQNNVLNTSSKYGVFDYHGNIKSLTANLITSGTMHGDRISQGTLQFNLLNTKFNRTSNFKMILVNSSNSFFSSVSSLTNGNYGVLDYQGNIVTLNAGRITSGTFGSNRIANGVITSNHLSASSVTGLKLSLSSQLTNSNWSNIIIDSSNKLIKRNNVLNTSSKYGVLDYQGKIASLDASLITTGRFGVDRIPELSANKITSDTIGVDRIPELPAGKITSDTFNVARIPSLPAGKITSGTFGVDRIADGAITGGKLSLNNSARSGTWNNILLDNNNNLIKTSANVTNYGVFAKNGNVTTLNSDVLNSVGLKFFTPTTDEGKIDESSYLATRFIIYTGNFYDIPFSLDYYQIFNYKNITDSANILYDFKTGLNSLWIPDGTNGTSQINEPVNTTYTTLYNILKSNINTTNKYLRFKTSLYIDSIEFPAGNPNYKSIINNNAQSYDLSILSNVNSKFKLIIGVYTNIYTLTNNINSENKNVILIDDKLLVDDKSNFTLLGYIFVDMTQINGNKIQLNKEYNFDSTINYDYKIDTSTLKDNIIPSVITFKPLYYINAGLKISSLFYSELDNDIQNFLNNISFNDNMFSLRVGVDVFIKYDTSQIIYENNQLKFNKNSFTIDNNFTLMNTNNIQIYTFKNNANIDTTDSKFIIVKNVASEPIEKNIKLNLKPTTRYSQIIYTNPLSNKIDYKFSLFSIDLTVTDYVGEYPSIIQ
jgi:hypothetical protein